jgi:hypothetical protein
MVWTIRPDESRTTSRQVWAGENVARGRKNRAGRSIAFMRILTVFGWDSFDLRVGSLLYIDYQWVAG